MGGGSANNNAAFAACFLVHSFAQAFSRLPTGNAAWAWAHCVDYALRAYRWARCVLLFGRIPVAGVRYATSFFTALVAPTRLDVTRR